MSTLWRLVRYFAAGTGSFLVDAAFQWLFVAGLGLPVLIGGSASYEIGLLAHFLMVNHWVFGHRRRSLRRLVEFHVAAATAFLITISVTWLLSEGPLGRYLVAVLGDLAAGGVAAKAIGTAAAMLWTFASSFFWIWHPRRGAAPRPPGSLAAPPASGEPVAPML